MTTDIWQKLTDEARSFQQKEPQLEKLLTQSILKHDSFSESLASWVGTLLESEFIPADMFAPLMDKEIERAATRDIYATLEGDPACIYLLQAYLNFKGFKALLAYRFANKMWREGQKLGGLVIQGRIGDLWDLDIHPAAKIGSGIMIDHANSIVIGETAEVGDDTSILHGVTLGGRGSKRGDRHPKVGKGVFIGTGASILGNIKIGDGARIAAGSIVLQDVPANATAVGAPARIIEAKSP
jgi:serine O-acetyltransferase